MLDLFQLSDRFFNELHYLCGIGQTHTLQRTFGGKPALAVDFSER